MRKAVVIYLLFAFASCSQRPVPAGIIAPDQMKKVVYDILKADEYVNNFVSKDTAVNVKMKRSIVYEQVFTLHNTNRKEFYTSYKYYQEHPDIQKTLFDSLLATANRDRSAPSHVLPVKPVKLK